MRKKILYGALLCLLCALFVYTVTAQEEAYGMVQEGSLNIRDLPSMDAEISGAVAGGTRVHILGQQDDWYYAETPDGKAGYMHAQYVTLGQPGTVENAGNFVNLRAEASFEAEILGAFDTGTPVEMYAGDEEWTQVYVEGLSGYMATYFLKPVQSTATEGITATTSQAPAALLLPEMTVPGAAAPSPAATPDPNATPLPAHLVTVVPTDPPASPQVVLMAPDTSAEAETQLPAAAEVPAVQMEASPYLLLMDSGEDLVQQYGVSESYVDYREGFFCTVVYPVSGLEAADTAMREWARQLVQNAEQAVLQAGDISVETELTVQYDAYVSGGRYVGIQETGWYNSSLLSEPEDVVYTQNIDLMTGTLMTYQNIFSPEQLPGVLELLAQKLSALPGDPLGTLGIVPQEGWLEEVAIFPEGIAVLLPKGMHLPAELGTQRILLPYEELSSASLLAMEVPGPTEAAQASAGTQALPVGPGQRTIDPTRPMVALTFDDGPSETTPKILDLLTQYGGRATFFVVGNRLANYSDILVQIAEQGSEIGGHTWSHKKLTELKDSEIERQISRTNESVLERTGVEVRLMRPPYGSHNQNVRAVSRNLNLGVIFWSIDTEDWRTRSASATYDVIMENVKSGSIILCHDLHEATGAAMERVIPALVEQGYQLVTVSELLAFLPNGMEPGRVYSNLDTSALEGQ